MSLVSRVVLHFLDFVVFLRKVEIKERWLTLIESFGKKREGVWDRKKHKKGERGMRMKE